MRRPSGVAATIAHSSASAARAYALLTLRGGENVFTYSRGGSNKSSILTTATAAVFAAVGCGSTNKANKSSAPPSFDSIKVALLRARATICDEVRDPNKTFNAIVGATDARSYFFAPCPNGGIVAVGSFRDETSRDMGLRYLLGLDKRSFTPGQSGPIWKNGWRLGTSAVVIAADTPPAATKQIDRAMTAVHGEPVR